MQKRTRAYRSSPCYKCCYGGEGGIRTHVELPPNGFQDRPVMTASVPLQNLKFYKLATK